MPAPRCIKCNSENHTEKASLRAVTAMDLEVKARNLSGRAS